MKYFTKNMWRGSQRFGPEADECRGLRGRIGEQAYDFFAETDIHDAELIDVRIIDGNRPAQLEEPVRPWQNLMPYPVRIELTVLDARERYVWRVVYSSVRSALIDFPSSDPLFTRGESGFDDLGYHELTDAGGGLLRHEILFSSGAILAFQFKELEISSTPARAKSLTLSNRVFAATCAPGTGQNQRRCSSARTRADPI